MNILIFLFFFSLPTLVIIYYDACIMLQRVTGQSCFKFYISMIGSFSPFPVHCVQANSIVCGQILLGPQRGHPQGALHLLLIRGAAPQPSLSNLAARLKYNYVGLGVERGDRVWGCSWVQIGWGLGCVLRSFHIVGDARGAATSGGDRGRQGLIRHLVTKFQD